MASLDKILETPPAELIADLSDMRQQKLKIENREAVILQLLNMILERGGPAAEEVVRVAADAAIALGPLRDQIRNVFASLQAEDEWFLVPVNIHQALVARGNETATLDHVRTTMTRMAEAGELVRPRNALLFGLPNVVNNAEAMQALESVMGPE